MPLEVGHFLNFIAFLIKFDKYNKRDIFLADVTFIGYCTSLVFQDYTGIGSGRLLPPF